METLIKLNRLFLTFFIIALGGCILTFFFDGEESEFSYQSIELDGETFEVSVIKFEEPLYFDKHFGFRGIYDEGELTDWMKYMNYITMSEDLKPHPFNKNYYNPEYPNRLSANEKIWMEYCNYRTENYQKEKSHKKNRAVIDRLIFVKIDNVEYVLVKCSFDRHSISKVIILDEGSLYFPDTEIYNYENVGLSNISGEIDYIETTLQKQGRISYRKTEKLNLREL